MLRAVEMTVDGAGRHFENFRRVTEGRPWRKVVDKRQGYMGSASLVGTSREGGIG
jgi:hypothetical protein